MYEMWYGPDLKPIDRLAAEALLRDPVTRVVVKTGLVTECGTIEVSTVFLVLDHSFGTGLPVLWETMVFGGPRSTRRALW